MPTIVRPKKTAMVASLRGRLNLDQVVSRRSIGLFGSMSNSGIISFQCRIVLMWGSIGKLAGGSLGVVLAALPFFYYNSHFSPYEVPKTWLLTGCAVVSLVLAIGRHESLGVKLDRKLVWSVAILWGWLFAVSLTTGEFWSSWWGNPYRADGLLTLLAMITLGLTFPVSDKWLRLVAISNLILTTWE
mgnify:CR=1 FL=1